MGWAMYGGSKSTFSTILDVVNRKGKFFRSFVIEFLTSDYLNQGVFCCDSLIYSVKMRSVDFIGQLHF